MPDAWKWEDFRKIIKHVRMIRTLRHVWLGFHDLREKHTNSRIGIEMLPAHPRLPLNMEPVITTMERFTACGKKKQRPDFAARVQEVTSKLENGNRQRYFHCELQLLERSLNRRKPENFEHYFGCSKLSCFLCWELMRDSWYCTKGTHQQLYPDCCFPFNSPGSSKKRFLGQALKGIQDGLEGQVATLAKDLKHYKGLDLGMSHTQSASHHFAHFFNQPQGQTPHIEERS